MVAGTVTVAEETVVVVVVDESKEEMFSFRSSQYSTEQNRTEQNRVLHSSDLLRTVTKAARRCNKTKYICCKQQNNDRALHRTVLVFPGER